MDDATEPLFRDDAYLATVEAAVAGVADNAVIFDRTVFYPAGGGQPGDTGRIERAGGDTIAVSDARYTPDRSHVAHLIGEVGAPAPGETVTLHLDWARRYRHMRMHTALHLLSVALPFPVTGGQIGAEESRLDFDIPEAGLDRDEIAATVNRLVEEDHAVTSEWITDEELDANPDLVKTMAVKPPRGSGRVRLVRIGDQVDLQPCGGTHVRTTSEIGRVDITKIEKKGRQNRRVRIRLA